MFQVNRDPSKRDLVWFAGGLLVGFPLLAGLLYWVAGQSESGRVVLLLAIALVLLGFVGGTVALAMPNVGRKLYIVWMTATLPVGIAVSTVLLSLMYFLFLPLFSLIVRRQDPLRKKLGGATYWEDYKPHEPTLERMRRPF